MTNGEDNQDGAGSPGEGDLPPAAEAGGDADWSSPERLVAEADGEEGLNVEVDGYEGPLDLLLALARTQKVDLASISVLALAEQYLDFIAHARQLKLEVAAEYLVMAAWLAFLKSKLLLPREDKSDEVASAEEMAQRLAFRLMRLDAMRERAAQLMTRSRLGLDVFPRGAPERAKTRRTKVWGGGSLTDLLTAYASSRQRTVQIVHKVAARKVWSIKEARTHLQSLIGHAVPDRWAEFDNLLVHYLPQEPAEKRTVLASSFGATLEMAREGLIELRQDGPFEPIYVRRREGGVWERIK